MPPCEDSYEESVRREVGKAYDEYRKQWAGKFRPFQHSALIESLMKKEEHMPDFTVRDSGERHHFASGMQRDTAQDKVQYDLILDGPLVERYAKHMTLGAKKYSPRNWMKANSEVELARFRESAIRHFIQYMRGDTDEDHFAAVIFNLNGMEYVKERLHGGTQEVHPV